MRFNKKLMAEMPKAYSVCPVNFAGQDRFIVATEKVGPINLFDVNGELLETIMDFEGGVMSIVPVPGEDESFMTTYKFFSPNDGKDAQIVHIKKVDGKWQMKTLADIPFVHRFEILSAEGKNYLIACTIKTKFDFKNDWNHPGKILVAELPEDLSPYNKENQIEFKVLKEGLMKNHGFYKVREEEELAIVTAVEGVFKVFPPKGGSDWEVRKVLDQSTSDAIYFDLDGDGKKELVTFSEFHGDHLDIYKEVSEDEFEKVYSYKKPLKFLHALFIGQVDGKPVLFVGHREGARDLFALTYNKESDTYDRTDIDSDVGVANINGLYVDGKLRIVGAHRETDQACLYELV